MNPTTGLIAVIGVAAIFALKKLNDHMSESAIQSDIFGDKVSEGTKKAVGGFLELSDEAERSLTRLKSTGEVVSQETVDSIAGNFENMGGQISKKIEENKQPALDSLTKMYTEMGRIKDQDVIDTINRVQQSYDDQLTRVQEGENRVREILETAKNEKRTLTEGERQEITTIQNLMKDDGIRILSESEQEYNIIRQRMKDQAGELSAEQASKLVQDSITTRDETIKKAEEEYDERIRIANQLKADGTKESTEAAYKIIEDAKNTRDETVKAAEDSHNKIVEEAKLQAGEHVKEVDWETGQIKTGWQIFFDETGKAIDGWWKDFKKSFKDGFAAVKRDFDGWIEDQKEGFEKIGRHAKENIDSYVKAFTELPGRISDGFHRGWNWVKDGISNAVTSVFENLVETVKGMFDFTLPMPRIPRPEIEWETHSVLGMDFSIPSGISWHKKGAIFTRPTIFATGSGFHGVGEAGPEAVLPIEKLDGIVANAMVKAGGNGGVTITGNTFNVRNEEDIEKVARKLYRLIESKKRGVGLG
ncbi:phage tail tape measure protein [Anaerococcus rubeinfantis]|uniref:phage tail tape measure protein n=1 Tax=Anaerococcus rubeinfantis TaxID=1720199 RepID=UPI00073F3AB7|nr:phage tail tape measure protein [Anaerococcus rubeinfantis]